MNDYYYIVSAMSGNNTKKLTYNQYLSYAAVNVCQTFKVLKKDWQALEKALKGVSLKDRNGYIFNRLHQERKTQHV